MCKNNYDNPWILKRHKKCLYFKNSKISTRKVINFCVGFLPHISSASDIYLFIYLSTDRSACHVVSYITRNSGFKISQSIDESRLRLRLFLSALFQIWDFSSIITPGVYNRRSFCHRSCLALFTSKQSSPWTFRFGELKLYMFNI